MKAIYRLDHLLNGIDLLILLGDWKLAETALEAASVVGAQAGQLMLLRGMLAQAQGQRDRAVTLLRLAVNRDPSLVTAWQRLGDVLPPGTEQTMARERAALLEHPAVADLRHGKPYLALGQFEALAAAHPDWLEWTILRAEALRRLGNLADARTLVTPLVRRLPPPTPAFWLLAALGEPLNESATRSWRARGATYDPTFASARRLFAPEEPPFPLGRVPETTVPPVVALRLRELGDLLPEPAALPPMQAARVAKGSAPTEPKSPPTPDPAREALGEVERITQRIFGQPPSQLSNGPVAALLVTHRANLEAHAPQQAGHILQLLPRLALALERRGVAGKVVIVDDADQLSQWGEITPAKAATPRAISQVIEAIGARLVADGESLDVVVLVGGDSIIPFHRLANPTTDVDREVLSDNPYGSHSGMALIPDVVVARLPDGGNDGGTLLTTLVERSLQYHQGWLSGPSPATFFPLMRRRRGALPVGSPIDGWAASALAWQLPSQTVYNTINSPQPLVLCPPNISQSATATWDTQRVLYFNLHGVAGAPNWYGQVALPSKDEPLPLALTPQDVDDLSQNAICVSEACYGAEIAGRTVENALALKMLQRNALAFIGSTATAYGSVNLPIGGADVLAQHLLAHLRRGQPVGRALQMARDGLARQAIEQQGYLDPDEAKTLLSFVLLGDPWATPYARPVLEHKSLLSPLRPQLAQRQPLSLNLLPPQSINAARRLFAKFVPYLSQAPLDVIGQSRPDLAPKNAAGRPQYGSVVFSAQTRFTTTDGRSGAHVARLTLTDETPRKLLISR